MRRSSSDLASPPRDISPQKLFRLLLRLPYPTVDISFRIRGAERVRLSVKALTWQEEMVAVDAAGDDSENIASHFIAASMLADGSRAFNSAEEVGQLSESEVAVLGAEVLVALSRISPSHVRSDIDKWRETLKRGALHGSNMVEVIAMAGCVDYTMAATVGRIDRYFGVPVSRLTEGHRLAFLVAREIIEEAREVHREQSANKRR